MKALSPFLLLALVSCGWNAAGSTGCQATGARHPLPEILRETSGVAWSRVRPGVLLSHNDGGHAPAVYALDQDGALLGVIPLPGAENRDWEDIATAECPNGFCIYLADVGDNAEVRERVTLYRLEDTGVYDGSPQEVEAFPMILPDGPRDIESLLVLPGEEVFLITKGRSDAVTLLRYPPPLRQGMPVTLEAVQTLTDSSLSIPDQITGADVSPEGATVVVRSYEDLRFYRWSEGRLVPVGGAHVALRTLHEGQGEGVGLGPGGKIALTSEAVFGRGASLVFLDCDGVGALGGHP